MCEQVSENGGLRAMGRVGRLMKCYLAAALPGIRDTGSAKCWGWSVDC